MDVCRRDMGRVFPDWIRDDITEWDTIVFANWMRESVSGWDV